MGRYLIVVLVLSATVAVAQVQPDTSVLDGFGYRLFGTNPCKCPPEGYKVDTTMKGASPYPLEWNSIRPVLTDSILLFREEEPQLP